MDSALGGTGKKFDWSNLDNTDLSNLMIAGGLSIEDVPPLEEMGAWGVDLNSKLEIAPGKRPKLIEELSIIMNKGYFGKYGGTFIPETLSHACEELDHLYAEIKDSDEFKSELTDIYVNYVGRPSPLYFAQSLTEYYGDRKFGLKERFKSYWRS